MCKKWFKAAIVSTGLTSALVGLLVLAGWYTGNESLIQLYSAFSPMYHTTALAFFISGTGLLLSVSGYRRSALTCGAVTGVIGILTLMQYGFNITFDLIELPLYPSSFPAQMAPNTATCFVFAGSALFLCGLHNMTWRPKLLGLRFDNHNSWNDCSLRPPYRHH
jgi:hypothetical protein